MTGRNNDHALPGSTQRTATRVPDEEIRANVEAHLVHSSHQHSTTLEVMVEVKEGEVTLLGMVPHRVMKQQIEEMAAGTPGVRRVENKLTIPLTAAWPDSP